MRRRSVLALLPASTTLSIISIAGCSEPIGMTDSPRERATIRIANQDDVVHHVEVEAGVAKETVVSKMVQLEAGESIDLKNTLPPPSGRQRYHLTVRLDDGIAKSDSHVTDDGFNVLKITIETAAEVDIEWMDAA